MDGEKITMENKNSKEPLVTREIDWLQEQLPEFLQYLEATGKDHSYYMSIVDNHIEIGLADIQMIT